MKAIYGMARASPRKKKLLFLIGYESLFTMFPQLWINETKRKRGEKSEDQSRNCYQNNKLTLFEKKFKYFFQGMNLAYPVIAGTRSDGSFLENWVIPFQPIS